MRARVSRVILVFDTLVRKCWNQILQETRALSRLFRIDYEAESGFKEAV